MPASAERVIRIGHSPDPDDAFMFYALTQGKLAAPRMKIQHVLKDIETLNQWAIQGELEVTAFSLHAYAYCAPRYRILAAGTSMGDGYGPIVVAKQAMTRKGLASATVAIPGKLTTASLVLGLYAGPVKTVVLPFDRILEAVRAGRVAAGVLIHEGQLTYADCGVHKVVDLGWWWRRETGLPLPLGVNGVRRDLPVVEQRRVARLMRESIAYALRHREEAIAYARRYARGLDRLRTDRFVRMYVNHWTEDCGKIGRAAMEALLRRSAKARWIPPVRALEFVI